MAGSAAAHSIFKVSAEGRKRLIVFDTQDLSLGRSPENDLAFDDPEMSRKHAVFVRTKDGCRVKDMGTPNGTGVNGESVDHATLTSGDVVQVGDVEITYAETSRDPKTLGPAVEYASQIKAFAVSLPEGDAEETVLGVSPASSDGAASVTEQELDAALDLLGNEPDAEGGAPRDLDAELSELGFDESDLGEPEQPLAESEPPAEFGSTPDDVWELDDEPVDLGAPEQAEGDALGLDLGRPPGTGTFSIRLELEGLEGELRTALEALAGKQLELPRLRVKIETDD